MRIAEQIRAIRKSKGMTLEQLAHAAGISLSYLSDIERGRTSGTMDTIEAIVGAMGCQLMIVSDEIVPVSRADLQDMVFILKRLTK